MDRNCRDFSNNDGSDDSSDDGSGTDSTSNDSDHYSTNSAINEGEDDSNFVRCEAKCPLTGTRCYKAKGHDKRHGFTPKNLLSPSTIYRLLKDLTSGAIRSRAGLDNIDVKKGSENFEKMRMLVTDLSDRLSGEGKTRRDQLVAKIDEVEEFHKVDFGRHFKATISRTRTTRGTTTMVKTTVATEGKMTTIATTTTTIMTLRKFDTYPLISIRRRRKSKKRPTRKSPPQRKIVTNSSPLPASTTLPAQMPPCNKSLKTRGSRRHFIFFLRRQNEDCLASYKRRYKITAARK